MARAIYEFGFFGGILQKSQIRTTAKFKFPGMTQVVSGLIVSRDRFENFQS